MKVSLTDCTPNAAQTIGGQAAICYDGKTDDESNIKRAMHCKTKGHLAVLRFAYATFNIEGISRVCSHQIVRVAHAGILQESQRYVEQSRIEWVFPSSVYGAPGRFLEKWAAYHEQGRELYKEAIALGMKKEDARYCLPQSCTTQLNICMNFQGWTDFLKNRTSKTAQWEVRDVAVEIQRQLYMVASEIFDKPA